MSTVSGFVEAVIERPSKYTWPNGKAKDSMFAIKVDGQQHGTRNVKPACKEGDYITCEVENDGKYSNVVAGTIKPATPPANVVAPVAPPATGARSGGGGGWNDPARQDSIIYQNSRERAIEMVTLLAQQGLIDYGKAKGAQKIELLEIFVDDYTVRFFEDAKRLAPPEHGDPADAQYSEEAVNLQKRKRTRAAPAPEPAAEEDDDELPFG